MIMVENDIKFRSELMTKMNLKMGTDCRLLAKLKDGTYRHRSLDRLYVFNNSFKNHDSIYQAVGLVQDESGVWATNYRFTLEHLTNWCYTRRSLLNAATTAELDEDSIEYSYHLNYINSALDFVAIILPLKDQIEWLGLYADTDDLYYDLKNDGTSIIDI